MPLSALLLFWCAHASAQPVNADALIAKHCVGCHNDKARTAGVSLSGVKAANLAGDVRTWEKVLRKTRTGEMPPLGMPKPPAEETKAFVTWLESGLDKLALAKPDAGTPAIHRLNRAEYSNAVRDLLALDLDHSATLPADDSGYGFDNIGDVLTISPLHMEKYMSTARRVTRMALGTAKLSSAVERFPANRAVDASEELPLAVRDGMVLKRYFPADAEYSILVRVRGNPPPNAPPSMLDLRVDGARVKLFETAISTAEEAQYTRNFEIKIPLKAGMRTIGASFLGESLKIEAGAAPTIRGFTPPPPTPLTVDYIQIGGPFDPKGMSETESRERIFVCRASTAAQEEPCARKILTNIARRAYRRPVKDADIAPLMKLYAEGRKSGARFESGIEMGLRAILVSPQFLFRVESNAKAAPGASATVSELELASRLSFFLWSSIPDEALLQAAEQGKLRATLSQQVRRMLADPKAKALVENFAGQWLHLRNIAGWRPDPEKYAAFDDRLRTAMQRETEMFFEYIVKEDRSVLDFLAADYTFLNDRLAKHYGIDGVRGSYFRQVALQSPERGGILAQGSVLTVTSYPTRTSPVLRGKWILENVLGAPPPPPPPDVPDLADSANKSPANLREALQKHREKAACASCHSRLDPLGFALENYDAIGKFRVSEGGVAIDASGSLPEGTTVNGPGDLKKILMDRRDAFVECLAEKMLTYALGRGLEHYDLPAVRKIRRETAAGGYKFSALAMAIANSVPFQLRRTPLP